MTGIACRIIARGSFARRPSSSRRLNAETIFSRLMAFCLRWAESGRRPSVGSIASRSLISSSSRSMRLMSCAIVSAPMPPSKYSP